MKVITLYMPWAFLIVCGEKQIETRSKRFNYRGTLGIHASVKFTPQMQDLCKQEPFKSALARHGIYDPSQLIPMLGHIVGTVKLVDCQPTDLITAQRLFYKLSDQERSFGDYTSGRFGWQLIKPEQFKEPIRAKGSQGIWHYLFLA